ncbi:MAG: hypothetical protein IJT36_00360 [Alphaproteobacteria bacterium]|nr:hypothetical protein [Alphaproteobacteria bacterium]
MASAEFVDDSVKALDYTTSNIGVSDVVDTSDTASVRGTSAPTSLWDWSNGDYSGSFLPLYRARQVYTNYRFKTGTSKLDIDMNLYASVNWTNVRTLTVELYSLEWYGWNCCDTKSFVFTPSSTNHSKNFSFSDSFTGLTSGKEYYIRFYNDSSYVSGSSSEYAIGCTSFTISV